MSEASESNDAVINRIVFFFFFIFVVEEQSERNISFYNRHINTLVFSLALSALSLVAKNVEIMNVNHTIITAIS